MIIAPEVALRNITSVTLRNITSSSTPYFIITLSVVIQSLLRHQFECNHYNVINCNSVIITSSIVIHSLLRQQL